MALDFDRDVAPFATRAGRKVFPKDPSGPSDVLSEAWIVFQAAPPRATPNTIVSIAIDRVKSRRHFSESERGIHYNPRRKRKGVVISARLSGDEYFREGDDPAERAALRIDFMDFLRSLKLRELAILVALVSGERTMDVAKRFRLTRGRISQYRREFIERWKRFTGEQ